MFTPGGTPGGRIIKSQVPVPGRLDMKGAGRPHHQNQIDQSNESDDENIEKVQKNTPSSNLAGQKKPLIKDQKKAPDANIKIGSEEGSQNEGHGQPSQVQDYNHYGIPQHPPYSYTSYNYQMPPHAMGAPAYGMYPNYSPLMGQRPPLKQYAGFPAYNYQERGYHPGMPMKQMQSGPEYYEEYKYGDNEVPIMRSPMVNQPVFHAMKSPEYVRTPKGQKPMMGERPIGQYPGYQYAGQPMSPMYQPVPHAGHYDIGSPYDYAQYKKSEVISPNQPGYYYKNMAMPPYSYEKDDPRRQPQQKVETPLAVGSKPKKTASKPTKPTEDIIPSKDTAKSGKVGKSKQFAEDLDNKNIDE